MTKWRLLCTNPRELRINTTLNCGQAFRWKKTSENEWTSVLFDRIVSLKETSTEVLFVVREGNEEDDVIVEEKLRDYFRLETQVSLLYAEWTRDRNFREKAGCFYGIRMLRQEPVECLFSFICSQNNNIQRIGGMVEKLCVHFGKKVGVFQGEEYFAFPRVVDLLDKDLEMKLRDLGFGYRAKYIAQAAKYLSSKEPDWLLGLRSLPYEKVIEELLVIPGVGPKVADCVALMCLDQLEAVPVDTHVYQIAIRDYKLKDTRQHKSMTREKYRAVGDLFRRIFKQKAGWAHTVLFTADLRRFRDRLVQEDGPFQEDGPSQDDGLGETRERPAKETKKRKTINSNS